MGGKKRIASYLAKRLEPDGRLSVWCHECARYRPVAAFSPSSPRGGRYHCKKHAALLKKSKKRGGAASSHILGNLRRSGEDALFTAAVGASITGRDEHPACVSPATYRQGKGMPDEPDYCSLSKRHPPPAGIPHSLITSAAEAPAGGVAAGPSLRSCVDVSTAPAATPPVLVEMNGVTTAHRPPRPDAVGGSDWDQQQQHRPVPVFMTKAQHAAVGLVSSTSRQRPRGNRAEPPSPHQKRRRPGDAASLLLPAPHSPAPPDGREELHVGATTAQDIPPKDDAETLEMRLQAALMKVAAPPRRVQGPAASTPGGVPSVGLVPLLADSQAKSTESPPGAAATLEGEKKG